MLYNNIMNNENNRKYQINNIINIIKNIIKPINISTEMDIDSSESNINETQIDDPMMMNIDSTQDNNVNDNVLFIINEILKINPDFFKIIVKTIKEVIINKNLNLLNVIENYDIFEKLFTDFDSFNESSKNLFNLDNFSDLLKFIVNIIIVNNQGNVNNEIIIENISKIIDSSVNIIRIFNLF